MKALFIALLIFPSIAFAQLSIGLSTGASFPVSDFSAKEIENDNAQFANAGFYVDLQPEFFFTENIGLMAVASIAVNTVDEDAAGQEISSSLGGNWQLSSTNYEQWQFLFGPSFRINNDQFTFQLTPFAGISSIDNISQTLNAPIDFPGIIANTSVNGDSAFTYGGQAALNFPLSNQLQLGLQIRYLTSQAERDGVVVTTSPGNLDRSEFIDDTALGAVQTGILLLYNL